MDLSIQVLRRCCASLLLYQSVLTNPVGKSFIDLLQALHQIELMQAMRHSDIDEIAGIEAYATWFKAIAKTNQSWQDFLITQILLDDNPFSQQVQHADLANLPPALISAARQDLQSLQLLYQCSGDLLSEWVRSATNVTPVATEFQISKILLPHRALIA